MLDSVMITQDALRHSSSSVSDTSASADESDKDSTRVFFGPLKTPEKHFAAIVAIPDPQPDITFPGPTQDVIEQLDQKFGSPSPSSSTCSDEIMDVERLVGLIQEREEVTGDDDGPLQEAGFPDDDEPSAVLASRLLRALDNPSPPPSPTSAPINDNGEEAELDGEEAISSSTESEILTQVLSPHELSLHLPSLPSTSDPPNEPDLMTFDSVDDIAESLMPPTTQQTQAPQTPPSPFSFLDAPLARASITCQTEETFRGHTDILVDVQEEMPAAGPSISTVEERAQEIQDDEENESAENMVDGLEQGAPIPDSGLNSTLNPVHPLEVRPHSADAPPVENSPHTPVRRSSRPRKSATPHILKYLATPSPNKDQTSPVPSTPSGSQTRKSRKGKERTVIASPGDVGRDGEAQPNLRSEALPADERPFDVKAQRRYSRSPIKQEIARELGSLSPNSTDLLTRLIPSGSPKEEAPSQHCLESTEQGPQLSVDHPLPSVTNDDIVLVSPIQPSTPTPETSSTRMSTRMSTPARVPVTPRRSHIPISPSKLRLQPISLDDPTRTPARRIPIEQAVAEGHVSPQKLTQMQTGTPAPVNLFTGQAMPILNTSLKGDASPARRVFVTPSIDREATKSRSSGFDIRQVSRGTGSSASQKAVPMSQPTKLPFPLAAAPKMQLSPEQDVVELQEPSGSSNPAKSSLKQTTSRIPRKKPYAKPTIAPSSRSGMEQKKAVKLSASRTVDLSNSSGNTTLSKRPTAPARPATGTQTETATNAVKRVIRAVDLSKTTTGKRNNLPLGTSPTDATTSVGDLISGDKNPPTIGATTGNLKRKRIDSKVGPVASSRATTMRQVTSTVPTLSTLVVGRPTATASLRSNNPTSTSRIQGQATQKPIVMKFRRVMTPEPQPQPQPPQPPLPPDMSKESGKPDARSQSELMPNEAVPEEPAPLPSADDMIISSPVKEVPVHSPPLSPPTMTPLSPSPPPPLPPLVFVIDPRSPVSEPAPLESVDEGNSREPSVRRTTRLRKPMQTQPGTNIFNSDPNATLSTTRPLQRRRTNTGQNLRSTTDDVFSGMSMTALKALTANNTVRNQQYAVANLETEIVRRDGTRPESPAVKIKTIVQRQQEEKIRQREERAARRAKRHGDNSLEEGENVNDVGYESPTPAGDLQDLHLGNVLAKHRRGAGDEEDYETPLKIIDGGVNGKRRVRWDRGLYTEAFLDEVVSGAKIPLKENVALKGCLTPSAKTLRLDTLGNLSDSEDALLNLTQEQVIVKKFVYDDDVEAVPQQPVTPIVRNTRSKSKKAET